MIFNEDILDRIESLGIKRYELAYFVGVDRATLWNWLKVPLNEERKRQINDAIQKVIESREDNGIWRTSKPKN